MTAVPGDIPHIQAYGGTLLSRVVAAASTLVLHIIVARDLGPSGYAAVALYVTVLAVSQMLLSFGNEALLLREGGFASPRARSVAVIAPLLALVLSVSLAAAGPVLESFFVLDGLASLLFWGIPVLPLQLMQIVPRAELLRRQDFLALARYDAIGSLAGLLPAMLLFFLAGDVVAIALYLAVMHAMRFLLYRNRLAAPPASYMRQRIGLSSYLHSWRIISIETATFLTATVDDLVVAANLGARMLGIYHLAYRVITVTQEFLAGVMRTLGLPTYVRAAPDRRAVYRLMAGDTRFLAAIVLPMHTVLLLVADALVPAVLGAEWVAAIPVLQLLTFEALRQSMLALGAQGMIALGDERLLLRFSLTSAGVLLPAFVLLSFTDLLTFVAGFVGVNTFLNVVFFFHLRGSFARPFLPLLLAWMPGMIASAMLVLTTAGFRVIVDPSPFVLFGFAVVALVAAWWLIGFVYPDIRESASRAFVPHRRHGSARDGRTSLRVCTDGPFDGTNVHLRDLYALMSATDGAITLDRLDLRRCIRERWADRCSRGDANASGWMLHIHYPQFLYEGSNLPAAIGRGIWRVFQLLMLRVLGVRLVLTVHDHGGHEYTHRWWEGCVLTFLIHSADAITTLSEEAGRLLFEDYGCSRDVTIARHCVYRVAESDLERRRRWRMSHGISDDEVVILLYGTVRPYKGFDMLMQAALDAADLPLTLVCAGRGMAGVTEDRARPGLRILTFDRFVDAEETATLMDAADYGALPYRKILHSGTAMLFASHGCPVIAPRMGVFLDHEKDHAVGRYYDPHDPTDLRRVLREAADIPRDAYAAAFDAFRAAHREEDEARALLEVYRRLAGE